MDLNNRAEAMKKWRQDVEDFLGFPLQIPEYDNIVYRAEEYQAPVWDNFCWFYDAQGNAICRLTSHDVSLFYDESPGVPGVPDTWGTDEDWINLFQRQGCAPPFKGFHWNFSLMFFDKEGRPTIEIVARRTFRNDSRPTIHMAWYLTRWTYDASGNANDSHEWKYFDWELC